MSKMIDDAIKELQIHKENITALVLIGDAEDFQITKVAMHGASTAQLMGLIGTLEMIKLSLINTIKNGDGFVDDGEEPPEEFQDDEDEVDTKSKVH